MDFATDGLHLKESGKCMLANNFINGLNRISWNEEVWNGYHGLQKLVKYVGFSVMS